MGWEGGAQDAELGVNNWKQQIQTSAQEWKEDLAQTPPFCLLQPPPLPKPLHAKRAKLTFAAPHTPRHLLSGLLFQHPLPLEHISPFPLLRYFSPGTFPSFLNLCAHKAPLLPPPEHECRVCGGFQLISWDEGPLRLCHSGTLACRLSPGPWSIHGNKKPWVNQAEAWPGALEQDSKDPCPGSWPL